jgi:hypothetical protein
LNNYVHVQSIPIKFIGIRVSEIWCGITQQGGRHATKWYKRSIFQH